jgi:hypothetical protein
LLLARSNRDDFGSESRFATRGYLSAAALLRRDFSHRISAQATLTAALRILKAREMRYM